MNKDLPTAQGCLCLRPGVLEASTRPPPPASEPAVTQILKGEPNETLPQWMSDAPEIEKLTLAVPTGDVLIMITDFPSRDPAEIHAMVDLQAEEISPFPPERTQVAWEVCREPGSGSSRVLMALISKEKLQAAHDALFPFTGPPDRVDVEVMGWLEVMKNHGTLPAAEDVWILILTGEDATLVAWHEEGPVLLRSVGTPDELTAEIVREELLQARMNVETAFPGARMDRLQIWHHGEPPEWGDGEGLFPNETFHSLDEISPAAHGILERSRRDGLLDLAPSQWREEAEALKNRKKLIRVGAGAAAMWILLLGGFFLWSGMQSRQVRQLESVNLERREEVEDIRQLNTQVRSLAQFTNRERGALEALRVLAESTPGIGALELEEFRYRKEGGQIFMGTMGGNVQPFNRFLDELTASESLVVEDYDLKQTRNGYEFRIEMDWRWEDSL